MSLYTDVRDALRRPLPRIPWRMVALLATMTVLVVAIVALRQPLIRSAIEIRSAIDNLLNPAPVFPAVPAVPVIVPSNPTPSATVAPSATQTETVTSAPTETSTPSPTSTATSTPWPAMYGIKVAELVQEKYSSTNCAPSLEEAEKNFYSMMEQVFDLFPDAAIIGFESASWEAWGGPRKGNTCFFIVENTRAVFMLPDGQGGFIQIPNAHPLR